MAGNILSPEEHQLLTTIPTEIDDAELVRFFTLLPDDLALIDPRLNPVYRFDQVAHICLLRWLGWSPVRVDRLPKLAHVALNHQLEISVAYLDPPAARTSRLHAERARRSERHDLVRRKLAFGKNIQHFAAHIARGADDSDLVTHAALHFLSANAYSMLALWAMRLRRRIGTIG